MSRRTGNTRWGPRLSLYDLKDDVKFNRVELVCTSHIRVFPKLPAIDIDHGTIVAGRVCGGVSRGRKLESDRSVGIGRQVQVERSSIGDGTTRRDSNEWTAILRDLG